MDVSKRITLQKCREKIVSDLEVNDLIDELYTKLVIDADDRDKIRSQSERKFRTRCLLDTISQKGNEEYNNFVEILNKDYDWLANELRNDIGCVNHFEYKEQIYSEALTSGDVPQLPLHYVPRIVELTNIQYQLQNLKRGKYLVIHGMAGSGKSVLAISAVRNQDILKNNFNNCMYFVNAGEAKTELDVANLLYRLYIKLEDEYKNYFNPNIEYNEKGIYFMKDQLRKYFSRENRHEALLILDDVYTANMIEYFNFGCKTLITTQDISLVPHQNSVFYELNKGFNEEETLQLFSKCINMKKEKLPTETKKIHNLCKGAPLVIALIASNLEKWKEDANNKDRWNYYINMLIDKKDGRLAKAMQMFFRKKKENRSKDYLFNTIEYCLQSLPSDYREYYKHFALFVEDVNITTRVMEIVLKKSKYEIEDIVNELKNKSLIVCAYNAELKTYVYGIHDLLLAHLKHSLSSEELRKLHEKLIENYLEVSENDFSNLPNDNYIFTYIGYHLLEAKRITDFPNLYFDLKFIGAKIKAVGINGLIGDYVRYKKYITNNNDKELSMKLNKFEDFIQKYGQDLYKYPNTDIIQCGLQQPINSEIYEAALHIAQKQCFNTLYLQIQFFGQTVYVTHTLDINEDVCATCFAHKTNTILVGTNKGEINLWDHSYKSKLRTFTGHNKRILNLQLSSDADQFLSVSEDGTVKVWSLEDICVKNNGIIYNENEFHLNTPPPAVHQKSWVNFFGENIKIDKCKTYHVTNDYITTATFSNDNKYLLAGTKNGIVKIWDLKNDACIFEICHEGKTITSCTFSLNNSLILFSFENVILLYNYVNKEYLSQFMNEGRATSLLVVPYLESKIIAISDTSLTVWSWEQKEINHNIISIFGISKDILEKSDDIHYICGAVTWDGVYLVTASSDHCINIWNIETNEKVKEIYEHNGLILNLDTFLSEESNSNVMYILLAGSNNRTIIQWHLQEMENRKPNTKLLPIFSTYWIHDTVPLIAAINSNDQVQVFTGHALISESKHFNQPKCLIFSPCGNKIAVGQNDGIVEIFDFRNKKYVSVMNLEGPVTYMEYLKDSEDSNGYVLVAAAENTCFMACRNNESMRFKKPESKENIHIKNVSKTIKCFSVPDIKRILSIEENGSIKLWYFNSIEDVLVVKDCAAIVTMAVISEKNDMIAITYSDKTFRVYDILVQNDNSINCIYSQGSILDDVPRSCSFSLDGRLLAIGQDSGNIIIWSIETKLQLQILQLHTSWVRNVIFSPPNLQGAPVVLVSVGDQIAWWDISYIWKNAEKQISKNNRSRRSMRLSGPKELTLDTSLTVSLMDDAWIGKRGQDVKPELLSAIKLAGVYAHNIITSPNFHCFVTIDSSGLLYIMNIFRPP